MRIIILPENVLTLEMKMRNFIACLRYSMHSIKKQKLWMTLSCANSSWLFGESVPAISARAIS
jgi:hypothetical protein